MTATLLTTTPVTGGNKEMTDNSLTAIKQVTNAMTSGNTHQSIQLVATKVTTKTIFSPWKTITQNQKGQSHPQE